MNYFFFLTMSEDLNGLPAPSPSALALRAQALSLQGKPNAAIRDADRALQLNADSVLALRWRGKARAQKGDWYDKGAQQDRGCSSWAHALLLQDWRQPRLGERAAD